MWLRCILFLTFSFPSLISVVLAQPAIRFDVPAAIPVVEIVPPQTAPVSDFKTVEIVIPISTEIRSTDRQHIDEFRFDVSWNRNAYAVADYAPRTQTTSKIDGLINVEKTENSNSGIGVNARSTSLELLSIDGNANLSKRTTNRVTYQEIPQQKTLVASGTTRRGTGAFFRFHRTETETLEGGREVVVAYRVARGWRGGVLKIECHATGNRKIFGALKEPINAGRSFIVPVYLDGNVEAYQSAIKFVQTEQRLKRAWMHGGKSETVSARSASGAQRTFDFDVIKNWVSPSSSAVPKEWVHQLIQSGDDAYLNRYRDRLAESIASSATDFVKARQDLVNLGH